MRALKSKKPRRFRDHRRQKAKRWAEDYETIAEQYPPKHRLGRELVGLAADMLSDYRELRLSGRGSVSAKRKTAGLLLGALRVAADGANGHGHSAPPRDPAGLLEQLRTAPLAAGRLTE